MMYHNLKSKLENAVVKYKRALVNSEKFDVVSGFTLDEIKEFITEVCEEILKLEAEEISFWQKELRILAKSILGGKLEREEQLRNN